MPDIASRQKKKKKHKKTPKLNAILRFSNWKTLELNTSLHLWKACAKMPENISHFFVLIGNTVGNHPNLLDVILYLIRTTDFTSK